MFHRKDVHDILVIKREYLKIKRWQILLDLVVIENSIINGISGNLILWGEILTNVPFPFELRCQRRDTIRVPIWTILWGKIVERGDVSQTISECFYFTINFFFDTFIMTDGSTNYLLKLFDKFFYGGIFWFDVYGPSLEQLVSRMLMFSYSIIIRDVLTRREEWCIRNVVEAFLQVITSRIMQQSQDKGIF